MILMAIANIALASAVDAATLDKHIESAYFSASSGYYKEEFAKNDKAFNWTLGILISAQNSLAKLDHANIAKLKQTLEKGDTYWNSKGPVAGFDVLPGPHDGKDRYYDDNAWMVMSLVESYEITKDKRWLTRAEQALDFVLSGEDEKLGGGIYWKENQKRSKNTCSNGPAAAACLAVYHHNLRKDLLQKAGALYQWTKKNLRDPKDGIYYDSINLSRKVEKTKWTYNSALMLRSARELYKETKIAEYGQDTEDLQAACIQRWVKEDGAIDDELQFSHLLFENLDPSKFDATKSINKLKSLVQADGFFPKKWSSEDNKPLPKLIIQVSALRALAIYEIWVKQNQVKPTGS